MARIRTVKPQHWNDKELSKISIQAHLLWIGMWNFSDDSGVIENDPLLIKSQIFPRRTDVRTEQVKLWLDQLVKARFILPFIHENESYFVHRTFNTHQKIDKPQPSKISSKVVESVRNTFDEHSTNIPAVEYSKGEESKSKVKVRESKIFVPPTLLEVKNYFKEKGFSEQSAIRAFDYYNDADPPWTDRNGDPVRSWKSKMTAVWFKSENKSIETVKSVEQNDNELKEYLQTRNSKTNA